MSVKLGVTIRVRVRVRVGVMGHVLFWSRPFGGFISMGSCVSVYESMSTLPTGGVRTELPWRNFCLGRVCVMGDVQILKCDQNSTNPKYGMHTYLDVMPTCQVST